jgi:hypothetical protein
VRSAFSLEILALIAKVVAMIKYQVFISYSAKDSAIARKLYTLLQIAGANPFLAELNLQPGVKWKAEILNVLRNTPWVFFLATSNSCPSQAVAHEIGASLVLNKKLIPLMWGVKAKDLPPWVDDTQAVDLADGQRVSQLLQQIGASIKSDTFVQGIVVAALIGLGLWVLSKE